jgi:hypothetical protein
MWGQGGAPQSTHGWPPGGLPSPYGQQRQGYFGRAPQGAGFGGPRLGQPYYAPGRAPAPVRRRSPLRGLLMALMTVVLLAVGGLSLTNVTAPTSNASYENEDYRVPPPDQSPPPLPVPETYEEAEQWVVNSALYQQKVPSAVRCNAQPINVDTASDSQLKSHFESLMECLMRVWEPPLVAAGFQVVRPSVTIYGREITTKCGKTDVNAFYCSADQQVYFSNQLPNYVTIVKRNKWAADVVMAHEFGHAIQARTGILISGHALGQNSGSESTELELSRRLETQADCFAGMFTGAVSESLGIQQSDRAGIQETFVAVGDDTLSRNPSVVGNHGLGRSRSYWGTAGLDSSDVGTCNTFTAQRSLVR